MKDNEEEKEKSTFHDRMAITEYGFLANFKASPEELAKAEELMKKSYEEYMKNKSERNAKENSQE